MITYPLDLVGVLTSGCFQSCWRWLSPNLLSTWNCHSKSSASLPPNPETLPWYIYKKVENRVYTGLIFGHFEKKLKLRKTQNSSQIPKKLGPNFQKTQNLPTPLEFSCRNGDLSQKKMVFKTLNNVKWTIYEILSNL